MAELSRCVPQDAVIVGYDFSTGGVKALAFDLSGNTVAQVRLPTDLWTEGGVSELNLMQLEGQARAATRLIADELDHLGRLGGWTACGISATHHTAGRIDPPTRRSAARSAGTTRHSRSTTPKGSPGSAARSARRN